MTVLIIVLFVFVVCWGSLYRDYNADQVCTLLRICPSTESGKPVCRLFHKSKVWCITHLVLLVLYYFENKLLI